MNIMKKLSLGLALLGLSTSLAYAGAIDYEESGLFSVGAEALYVQPSSDNFTYINTRESLSNGGYSQRNHNVDPDYDWGWHVDIGYVMPGDGADFTLGWTQLDTTDRDKMDNLVAVDLITDPLNILSTSGWYPKASILPFVEHGLQNGGTFNANGAIINTTNAHAKVEFDYTDVDLVMGKEFVLQNRYHFHPFAGARYASIEEKDNISFYGNYTAVTTFDAPSAHARVKKEFSGVGPRAGVDAAVEIANGFSIVARTAGSVLIGDYDLKAEFNNYGYDVLDQEVPAPTYRDKTHRDNLTIPEVDYRLGVSFSSEFSPSSSFGIEAGWTGVHYFDALDNSDWAHQGPYVRFELQVS